MSEQALSFKALASIKVYRNSGRPVDPADDELYLQDWKAFYDKACERGGLDMLKQQRFLSYGAFALQKKHYKETQVTSLQEIMDLHVKVGFPLLVGLDSSTYEPIIVIQDA